MKVCKSIITGIAVSFGANAASAQDAALSMDFRKIEGDNKTLEFRYHVKPVVDDWEPSRHILVSVDRFSNIWMQGEGDIVIPKSGVGNVPWHVWNTSSFPMELFFIKPSQPVLEQLVFKNSVGESVGVEVAADGEDYFSLIHEQRVSNICEVTLANFSTGIAEC